jgi:translation initiation factor 2 beta subunit (eIF-2beta)/eIF-5
MNLPCPVGTHENKGTNVVNLRECSEKLGRPLEHLARFIAWQVRAPVAIYPAYVSVATPLDPAAPQQLMTTYIENCVRCKACKSLSTSVGVCSQCNVEIQDIVPTEVASMVIEVLD